MALGKAMKRLTKPVDELDREALGKYCDRLGVDADGPHHGPHAHAGGGGDPGGAHRAPGRRARVEVTVSDGRGSVVGVFLGRRKIPGMSPGPASCSPGSPARTASRYLVYNPDYELLG